VERIEKTGFRDFRFFPQGDEPALRARKALPEEKCNSQDQRMAVRCIIIGVWNSKMEILVKWKTLCQFVPLRAMWPGTPGQMQRAFLDSNNGERAYG